MPRPSFRTQISSVFEHPTKKDLFIALGDRWLPTYLADGAQAHDAFEQHFAPGRDGDGDGGERMEEYDSSRQTFTYEGKSAYTVINYQRKVVSTRGRGSRTWRWK